MENMRARPARRAISRRNPHWRERRPEFRTNNAIEWLAMRMGNAGICLQCRHPRSEHVENGCNHLDDLGPQPHGNPEKKLCACGGFKSTKREETRGDAHVESCAAHPKEAMGWKVKLPAFAVVGALVFAEPALTLACSNAESREVRAPYSCNSSKLWSGSPFQLSCHSLVERSFPPHGHAGGSEEPDGGTTTVEVSASGSVSNVAAQLTFVSLPARVPSNGQ